MNPIKKKTSRLESLLQNRSILEDRRVRLVLSALLAVALWVVITTVVQPGTAITLSGVPVDYDYDASVYTSRGLSIVQAPSKTVNLTVSGDGYTTASCGPRTLWSIPTARRCAPAAPRPCSCGSAASTARWRGNISVSIANTDSTVDIVFDVVEEKTLPVQVNTRYLTIEDGYILYSTAASNETVTLTGPSSELADVASCTAEVSYNDPLNDSVTVDTHLRFYNESGLELTFDYVTLDHDTVEVTLTVYKTAQLPVNVRFVNTPPNFDDSE